MIDLVLLILSAMIIFKTVDFVIKFYQKPEPPKEITYDFQYILRKGEVFRCTSTDQLVYKGDRVDVVSINECDDNGTIFYEVILNATMVGSPKKATLNEKDFKKHVVKRVTKKKLTSIDVEFVIDDELSQFDERVQNGQKQTVDS
jgi:hypothetical protein